jgi:hypothetical protein
MARNKKGDGSMSNWGSGKKKFAFFNKYSKTGMESKPTRFNNAPGQTPRGENGRTKR